MYNNGIHTHTIPTILENKFQQFLATSLLVVKSYQKP